MKFMVSFLIAMLPVASVAQSQSGAASGVPSEAIPPTTELGQRDEALSLL
jgi:hypothetical protein